MKHFYTSVIGLFICGQINAQTEPIGADTSRRENTDTLELMAAPSIAPEQAPFEDEMGIYEEYAVAEPATTYYEFFNKFKHDKKLKPIPNPDKKAYYSEGSGALLRFIAGQVNVPYYSSSLNLQGYAHYVLLQVCVGKDSLLYNPEILSSPGSNYSSNAEEVIEKLPARFIPAMKNGKPVDSILIIPIRFEANLVQTIYEYPAAK